MNVIVDQVCVPKEGRKSLMKLFADNHHINEEELMFHSNDVYTSNRKNKTKSKKVLKKAFPMNTLQSKSKSINLTTVL